MAIRARGGFLHAVSPILPASAFLLILAPCFALAPAQEEPIPAWKVLGWAREQWEGQEKVAYSMTYSLPWEDADFMAMSVVQGELCRTEAAMEKKGLHILIVKDGETCWSQVTLPEYKDIKAVYKTAKNYYLGLYHPLYRMMTLSTDYHDPMGPDDIIRVLSDFYEMSRTEAATWKGSQVYGLEGVMKPSFLSGKNEEEKRFLEWLKNARLMIDKETLFLLHLEFFRDPGEKPYYVRDFFDYDTEYPVSDSTFSYSPPENAAVRDLVTNEFTPAEGGTIEEIEEVEVAEEAYSVEELLRKSEENMLACGSVEFDVTQRIVMGGVPVESVGKYRGSGDKVRLELRQKELGAGTLKVSDGRFCWTEVASGAGPVIVYKSPAGSGLAFSRASLELGWIPGDYDLEYKGATQWKGESVYLLEGSLKEGATDAPWKAGISKARMMFYKDSLFLAGVEVGEDGEYAFTITCTGYKTGESIPKKVFQYRPPKGAVVRDMAVLSSRQLRLPGTVAKPLLPISEKAYFQSVPEDSRLEVILHGNGSITAFKEATLTLASALGQNGDDHYFDTEAGLYEGRDEIRGLMRHALAICGRTEDKLTDVDLVVYTRGDTPLEHLLHLIQTGAEDPSRIYRIHVAVRDGKTEEKGFLSYFLPVRMVAGNHLPGEYPEGWYIITLYLSPSAPYYTLERADQKGKEKRIENIDELETALDALKAVDDGVNFQMALCGIAHDPSSVNTKVEVQHLIDLMTLLSSKGADLKCAMTWVSPK